MVFIRLIQVGVKRHCRHCPLSGAGVAPIFYLWGSRGPLVWEGHYSGHAVPTTFLSEALLQPHWIANVTQPYQLEFGVVVDRIAS